MALGIQSALHERQERDKPRSLGDNARSYIINIACTIQLYLEMTQEFWTNRSLTAYIRTHAPPE